MSHLSRPSVACTPGGPRSAALTLLALLQLSLPSLAAPAQAQAARASPRTAPAAAPREDPRLAGLDAYVARAVADWEVPGLALAVVKDGEVVFSRGYGVRELGKPGRVDPDTLFAAASTTKAFTALALAMLVEEGKVSWDAPVSTYLPGFALADPYLTAHLTVRDVVSHRSGLPNADRLWYFAGQSARELVAAQRHLAPEATLRARYRYNNNLYAVAGAVIEAASGRTWPDFLRTRILAPLGMHRTLPGFQGLLSAPNVASAHDRVDGKVVPIPHLDFDTIAPAGAMNTSVAEMTHWLRFLLEGGAGGAGGKPLVSAAGLAQLLTPQTLIPLDAYYPAARRAGAHFTAYGLGWFLQDYRGRKLAMHTGSIDGKVALVGLLPEERLGLVVFANLDHAEVRHALMYRVFDAFTGAPPRDWSAELLALHREELAKAAAEERELEAARVPGTTPSLPPERYAGGYAHPAYGRLAVAHEGGRLVVRVGRGFTGTLEHWHRDTFRAEWKGRHQKELFSFTLGPDGGVREVLVGSGEDALAFAREAPAAAGTAPAPAAR
jgi:CubicO group peptidase (beta-lactamase class C family)